MDVLSDLQIGGAAAQIREWQHRALRMGRESDQRCRLSCPFPSLCHPALRRASARNLLRYTTALPAGTMETQSSIPQCGVLVRSPGWATSARCGLRLGSGRTLGGREELAQKKGRQLGSSSGSRRTSETYGQEQRQPGQHWGAAGTVQRTEADWRQRQRQRCCRQTQAQKQASRETGKQIASRHCSRY